jgi:hypothetical protein
MASHFIAALGIPALGKTKQRLRGPMTDNNNESEGGDEYDEDLDVETSMEAEASADDVQAVLAASMADFEAGDVIGKVMAFIAQIRACGEDTRDYLKALTVSSGCPTWELKLWVRTRWGSLSDCFRVVLGMREVCGKHSVVLHFIN